jgi:hypothetical protein
MLHHYSPWLSQEPWRSGKQLARVFSSQAGSGVRMHTGQGLGRVANKLTMPPCEMPETSTGRPGRTFTTVSGISLHMLQRVHYGP